MSSSQKTVLVHRDGPVTVVEIDRPAVRNAVDRDTAHALAAAFREFDDDPDAAVVVLHGRGGTFCAGADLKAISEGRPNDLSADGDAPMGLSRLKLGKPVIAAIEGYAVAGGLELALWADLRVAADDSIFGVFCRRWGVPLIDGGTVRLPRLIGASRAMDLILTGRQVSAVEAESIGLVNRIVEPGTALASAVALGHQLAALPQTCMRNDRLSMLEAEGRTEDDALQVEFAYGLASLAADATAGAGRFAGGEGRHGASSITR